MIRNVVVFGALALGAASFPVAAQNIHPAPGPEVRAVPLQGTIRLDGVLDEDVWRATQAATDFRQNQPDEGQPATQRTEVRFAYDGAALYVGARMFADSGAAGVHTRLVRRDGNADSDYLEVIFDSYHDHIGRLFFMVNPSGVRNDANGLGGGGDNSWDPVWEVKTTIDSLGWTAEMRIPFSQLRYPETTEEQTWGLQIWRQANSRNELSQWAFWGRTEPGGPAMFGHLGGLAITRAPGRAEILPYVVARSANIPVDDASNPFQDPHQMDGRVGLDAKVLLTSNLTLNATVNPDFGQVEVDPAVVNLSAFETFFDERRPFFVEGAGYFGFGGLNCFFCSNVSSLSMFYTRRIGRSPQGEGNAYAPGYEYADVPENTTILGAAKLTGRTPSGWSIGVLDAVTKEELADVQLAVDSSRSTVVVEPLTNYFVGRVAKDLRGGATVFRAIGTSVVRDLSDPALRTQLSSHAESFGLGTEMWFGQRDYQLMAQVAGTQVSGDSQAMLRVQHSSARYFQRPDRGNGKNAFLTDAYDPSLESIRGMGAYARFARQSGNTLWEVSTNLRTPGFENNDIAFLSRADYWWMSGNILRQWVKPTSWYRQLNFIVGGQQQYNFDWDLTDRQAQVWGSIETLNYWNFSAFYIHRATVMDDRLARGGPVLPRPALNFGSASFNTDSRKAVVASGFLEAGCNIEGDCDRYTGVTLRLRPASNILLSFGPFLGVENTGFQYVDVYDDTTSNLFYDRRYVFAHIEQRTVSLNTRFNVTFTPNLTFELFVQPLIASGEYTKYKEFAQPRELQKLVYGIDIGTIGVTPDTTGGPSTITVDADGPGGPAVSYSFFDPNFTFRSLRGNAVLRWEYRPGSTIYVVWARNAQSGVTRGIIDYGQDMGALFSGPAENIFMIKVNYWLGL